MSENTNQNLPPNQTPHQHRRHGHEGHGDDHPQKNYTMNDAEKRVLQECQKESFWYRALPFAVGAGLFTHAMITRGTLTVNSRFGSLPKVAFGCLTGYVVGKISYVSKCKQKFLKLEGSPISEMLRKGGGMPPGKAGSLLQIPGFPSKDPHPGEDATPERQGEAYSGFGQSDDYRSNLDIDTSNVKTMDNINNLDFDLVSEPEPGMEAKRSEMTKTYDDLRKESRKQPTMGHYNPSVSDRHQARQNQPPPQRSQEDRSRHRHVENELAFSSKKHNKYGDDMD